MRRCRRRSFWPGLGKEFLDMIPNHNWCKEELISWTLLKLKTCSAKKNIQNKKTSHRLGENICKDTSDKSKCMERCCCCSVTQSCLTLCNPMDFSTPGLPELYHLLESAQFHVHCISDAFQPSHPLTPSSALDLSKHQGLFQWVVCSHEITKILELQLQHQSFQQVFRVDFP